MSLNFTYLPRTLEAVIFQASSRYKGVLVTGMRQVGKSTMLRRMMGDRHYVNLDRYQALDLARQAPDAFFKQYPLPLLIDEFQRATDLGLELKSILDETDERGLVWLTGSQKLGLRKGAPKHFPVTLHPSSFFHSVSTSCKEKARSKYLLYRPVNLREARLPRSRWKNSGKSSGKAHGPKWFTTSRINEMPFSTVF